MNSLRQAAVPDAVMGIPPLLKRVALAAYPREIVASASGREWARILDHAAGTDHFESRSGALLDQAAYQNGLLDEAGRNELFLAAEQWIRTHRAEAFDQC